jgi:hypothetical protein
LREISTSRNLQHFIKRNFVATLVVKYEVFASGLVAIVVLAWFAFYKQAHCKLCPTLKWGALNFTRIGLSVQVLNLVQ